jgi:hypothetical protein
MAAQMGISNYTGTAAQNTKLLSMVQGGTVNTPKNTNTTTTIKTNNQKQLKDMTVAEAKAAGKLTEYYALAGLGPDGKAIRQQTPSPTPTITTPTKPTKPTDPTKPASWDQFPPGFQMAWEEMERFKNDALKVGKVLNPYVELSPEIIRGFMDKATANLDPYYKEQISLYDNQFKTSIDNMMSDYNKSLGRLDTSFKGQMKTQAQGEAESGTAFSSGRQEREARTVDLQNQDITDYTTGVQRSAQEMATDYESKLGSDKLRSLNIPGLTPYTATNTGVSTGTNTRSLYSPLGNIATGSLNDERRTAIENRANQLETAYRGQRTLGNSY